MSNFAGGRAGQASQEVIQAIRAVMLEFADFGKTVKEAGKATKDYGSFVANYAAQSATAVGRETAFGIASDVGTRLGVGSVGEVLDIGFVNALEGIRAKGLPGFSDAAERILQPAESTAGRILGVTGAMARAGADPQAIAQVRGILGQIYGPQEERASAEAVEVGKLKGGLVRASAKAAGVNLDFTDPNEMAAGLMQSMGALQEKFNQFGSALDDILNSWRR